VPSGSSSTLSLKANQVTNVAITDLSLNTTPLSALNTNTHLSGQAFDPNANTTDKTVTFCPCRVETRVSVNGKRKEQVKKNSSKSKDKLLVENVRVERNIYKKLSTVE